MVKTLVFNDPFPKELLEELTLDKFAQPLLDAIASGPLAESPIFPVNRQGIPQFEERDLLRGLSAIGYEAIAVPMGIALGMTAGARTSTPSPFVMVRAKCGQMFAFLAPNYDAELRYYILNESVFVNEEAVKYVTEQMKEVAQGTESATQAVSDFLAEPTATLFD